MIGVLRALGRTLLIGGLLVCAIMAFLAITNLPYYEAAAALERHPDHILFQAQYYNALAKHIAYLVTMLVSGFLGVFGSAVLLALAAILQRLEQRGPTA